MSEYAACPGREINLVNGSSTLLDFEAALADIAERADAGIELLPVGAREQAARPMAAWLERRQPASWCGDAARARRIGKGKDPVGVADIEGVADQRHAERLVQSLEKHALDFRDAVAVAIAQKHDAVRADADRRRPTHRAHHRIIEHALDRRRFEQRFRHQHIAIRHHLDPPGVTKTSGKRVHRETGSRRRLLVRAPASCRGHFERRKTALGPCRRDVRLRPERCFLCRAAMVPNRDRGLADQFDHPGKKAGKAHSLISCPVPKGSAREPGLEPGGAGLPGSARLAISSSTNDKSNGRSGVNLGVAEEMVRLLAAAIVGGIIGINRDIAAKPIGLRTLALVSLGAAIATVAAIQVPGIAGSADALSRVVQGVIQGIMTGISFIGAGVVLRDVRPRTVEGLTTASTVWVAAALGIACGLGAWTVTLAGTILALVFLVLFEWLETKFGIGKPKKE